MIRISKMAITLIFFIWIDFLISFLFSFFLFISFSVFCFVFWRSFHQTVSATPALSSLILRQWNQKNVTKAPQYIIICKKSLFFTAVDLSMKVAMEREKEKKNEKKKKNLNQRKELRSSSPSTPPFDWKEYYGKGNKLGLIGKGNKNQWREKKKGQSSLPKTICTFFLFLSSFFFFLAGKREQVSELIAIVITTEEEVRIF